MTSTRRLHPLTPLLQSWRLAGAASAIGFGVFRDEADKLAWIWHALNGDVDLNVVAKSSALLLGLAVLSVFGGWLSWRVTGYAIVQDGVGVTTLLFHRGLLVKQRSQVRLNRVQSVDVNQPLVPRLCGLAAVRLDMAAGDDASLNLAYLRHSDAWALRTEILRHTTVGAAAFAVDPADRPADRLVAEISTPHLVKANLLDGIGVWTVLVLWLVGLVVVAGVWGTAAFWAGLSGFLPVTIALVATLRKQLRSMLRDANFRLYRTGTGIRISSGLTSTANRTIDLDRIQGVRLVEPFLWRRLGWAGVKVDIAGASGDGEEGASLMPVADRLVALALIADVTGERLDTPDFVGAGARARRLDPLGWAYLGVALLPRGAVRRQGRWRRSTSYVPFARVQSVTAHQGLVQRRLDLATVHLDLPTGAERWSARHRGVQDAAELAQQLARSAAEHRLGERATPSTS